MAAAASSRDGMDSDYDLAHCTTKYEWVMFLRDEINHMMEHGVMPPMEWFETRISYIHEMADAPWCTTAAEFVGRDEHAAEACQRIHNDIEELLEDWAVSPVFTLSTYYDLLNVLGDFLPYYYEHYADENLDEDVTDLIVGMHRL